MSTFTSFAQEKHKEKEKKAIEVVRTETLGVKIPKIALIDIANPAPLGNKNTPLKICTLVYNTTKSDNIVPGYYYWNGTIWVNFTHTIQKNEIINGKEANYIVPN